MFSFIYTLIKYTIGNKSSIKNESDEINNVIARIEMLIKKKYKKMNILIKMLIIIK